VSETLPIPTQIGGGSDLPVLTVVGGMVGFPGRFRFVLVRADDDPSTCWFVMRCLDDPDLSFVVTHPSPFFAEYAPEIDDAAAARLGLTADTVEDEAMVLVVVTVGEQIEESTANLLAPLVVNRSTREGVQVVLGGSSWSLREPLVR
jgi:flagellar assembly factor FliW